VLLGAAAVAMWWDVDRDHRAEFEDWHAHEHFPERLSIPGFRRGSRWVGESRSESMFVFYELDTYETMASPDYLARLNNPTPWSTKMMPHHRNMVRSLARVVISHGGGIAGWTGTLRFSPPAGQQDDLKTELAGLLAELARRPGLTGAHLLVTDAPTGMAATTEQRMRGGDAAADWIVILSGYDRATVDAALHHDLATERVPQDAERGARLVDLYRLAFAFTREDHGTERA
jgi:hypothetical protein